MTKGTWTGAPWWHHSHQTALLCQLAVEMSGLTLSDAEHRTCGAGTQNMGEKQGPPWQKAANLQKQNKSCAGILKWSCHSLEPLCRSSTHHCAMADLVAHRWQNYKKPGNHQISTAVTHKVPLPLCSKSESRLILNIPPPPLVHEALDIWTAWCWGQHQRCKPGYQTLF